MLLQKFPVLFQLFKWTMATPVAHPQGGNSSNQDTSAYTEPVRELVDVANTHVTIQGAALATPVAGQTNLTESTNETNAPTEAAATKPKAKRTRAKVAMSNKHLLASGYPHGYQIVGLERYQIWYPASM